MADSGNAIDPGQQSGGFKSLQRFADGISVALGRGRNQFDPRETAPGAVGVVEAPQQHPEHP
jgi:hypothetical protein